MSRQRVLGRTLAESLLSGKKSAGIWEFLAILACAVRLTRQDPNPRSSSICLDIYIIFYRRKSIQQSSNTISPTPPIIISMGITLVAKTSMPSHYSFQDTKDIIDRINALSKQNQAGMGLFLYLQIAQLKYNHKDWPQSMIPGFVGLRRHGRLEKFHVVVSLQQAYKAYDTLKHFQKRSSIHPQNLTPSAIEPDEDLSCCICLDKAPSMMLPCSHQFCDKCTQTHIIEQPEKKCPICRMQFYCGREEMQKQIYTVISDQDELEGELRNILLNILEDLNGRQVQNIKEALKIHSFVQNAE